MRVTELLESSDYLDWNFKENFDYILHNLKTNNCLSIRLNGNQSLSIYIPKGDRIVDVIYQGKNLYIVAERKRNQEGEFTHKKYVSAYEIVKFLEKQFYE